MPSTALTILQAQAEGIGNFSLFCNHITIIPTIKAILDSPDMGIDGFLGPGHVSMVIGTDPYDFIARDYHRPLVVAGFEPLDVLHSVWMVLRQMAEGRAEIENQYARIVPRYGNEASLAAVTEVFELREFFEWRGLGSIDHSGVQIREAYAAWDAERKFAVASPSIPDPKACQCGEVLKGAIKPWQCKLFVWRDRCGAGASAMNAVTPTGNGRLRAERVTLAHGGGGKAMRDLIEDVFTSVFEPDGLEDQARLSHEMLAVEGARLAFTTDSFVVQPLEFPGGDIGKIAVCGTVNDLTVGGAQPLWLSAAFIIEEGTEVALLR
ncbi:hypothetical protein A4X03_0g9455, partial [Tilletia caries]